MTFQEIIFSLQQFWSSKGCIIGNPYDIEKGAVVIPGDLLLLDYDDYEDDVKIEKSTPKYLAFVKSKKDSVHYIV